MKAWAASHHPIAFKLLDSCTMRPVAGIVVIELKVAGVRNTTRVHPSNIGQPAVLFRAPNHVASRGSRRIWETTALTKEPAAKPAARFGLVSLHPCTAEKRTTAFSASFPGK